MLKGCGNLLKNFKIILIEFRNDNHYLNYYPKKVHKLLIKNNTGERIREYNLFPEFEVNKAGPIGRLFGSLSYLIWGNPIP